MNKALFKEKEFWILLFIGVGYFYRPLFLRETFFFRDLYLDILPHKQVFADFLNARELPLWNPYLHGGQPYLADLPYFPFYPSNLLYLFLPVLRAFNLTIVFHLILGSVSAYLCSRVIGLRTVSSFIVGILYGFCGYTLSLTNLGGRFIVIPYLPLLLMFWHVYLLERKRRWFILAVAAGVLQILAGAPETNVVSMLLLLGWALCYHYPHRSIFQKVRGWVLLGVFIVGIASIQLLPAAEMASQSYRRYGLRYTTFTTWSLHPERCAEIIFPGLLGYVDKLPWNIHYWGGMLVDQGNPCILSIYFGAIAVALAVFGGLHRNSAEIFPFKVRIFLFSLVVSSLLLSFGRFLPFFHLLFRYVPFVTVFRYPIKFFIAGIFPLALLAGYASEVHFDEEYSKANNQASPTKRLRKNSSGNMRIFLWGIAAIFFMFTAMFLLSKNFAHWFLQVFFKRSAEDVMHHGVSSSCVHVTVIWFSVTLLYQYRRIQQRQWQHWMLAGILVIDLLLAGRRVNFYAPEELFTDIPQVVSIIHHEIGDGRLFRTEDPEGMILQVTANNIFQIPPDSLIWGTRWNLATLFSHIGPYYKVPIIFHDTLALGSLRLEKLRTLLYSLPWEQRLPLLSAGGVTLILTSEDFAAPGIRRLGEIPNWSDLRLYLYRNETAAARVEFVTNWQEVDSDAKALGAMLHPNFDPRKHVVLQKSEAPFSFPFSQKEDQQDGRTIRIDTQPAQDIEVSSQKCRDLHININKNRSNAHSTLFSVSSDCDGYLVFSEPFYPGWHVSVDGRPTPILRANFAFSAVFLQAGEHDVERWYRPTSLLLGILSALVFCGLLFVVTYFEPQISQITQITSIIGEKNL